MLRAIFGSFSNAKHKEGNEKYRLEWVSYLLGKRESRRLVGDHIFTFKDVVDKMEFSDSVVVDKRAIDVHYQRNLQDEKLPDFLSEALFYKTGWYIFPIVVCIPEISITYLWPGVILVAPISAYVVRE